MKYNTRGKGSHRPGCKRLRNKCACSGYREKRQRQQRSRDRQTAVI